MELDGPQYVYRLARRAEWDAAARDGALPLRAIDRQDGYMHLSTREQALETARLHFAEADDLLALEFPVAKIADKLKFELAPKRGEKFPHYYGTLQTAHVTRAIALTKSGGGFRFGEAL